LDDEIWLSLAIAAANQSTKNSTTGSINILKTCSNLKSLLQKQQQHKKQNKIKQQQT
jgi:hypothetical protein